MKSLNIRFFSLADNSQAVPKVDKAIKRPKVVLTGYVSSAGKLVLPAKTAANLGVDISLTHFKVGMDEGKRKATSLYLVPAKDEDVFVFDKAAKSYTLALPFILKNSGINYAKSKYVFTIRLFNYEGTTAFELKLVPETATTKEPYTGKPRGRKPKSDQLTE